MAYAKVECPYYESTEVNRSGKKQQADGGINVKVVTKFFRLNT